MASSLLSPDENGTLDSTRLRQTEIDLFIRDGPSEEKENMTTDRNGTLTPHIWDIILKDLTFGQIANARLACTSASTVHPTIDELELLNGNEVISEITANDSASFLNDMVL